jgi:hypothetical protein
MLVKEWTVVGGGTTGLLVGTDIVDANGTPAQGNADPESVFRLHYIVLRGNDYFDPSYGTGPFPSQNDHEDAAMAAFRYNWTHANVNVVANQEVSYTPTGF